MKIHSVSLKITLVGSLFITFSFFLLFVGCSRVDTNWHRYKERNFEIIGTDRHLVEVVSDGWRIISKTDNKNKDEYEWGWEISIKTLDIPKEKKFYLYKGQEYELLLGIKEIQYILLDEDGFELAKDTLQEKAMSYGLPYGVNKTYRHTSTISKEKALRASKSVYKIILN